MALGMLSVDSPIGGEGNGGVIYPAIHHTRDAPAGIALILSHLALRDVPLSAAAKAFPTYAILKAKVPLEQVDGDAFLARAADALDAAEVDRTDGLKLLWPGREEWLHLRKSGTEPLVRIMVEAPSQELASGYADRLAAVAEAATTKG